MGRTSWRRVRARLPVRIREWWAPATPPDEPLWRLWHDVWRQTPYLRLVLSGLRDGRRGATLDTLTVLATDRHRSGMRAAIAAAEPPLRRQLLLLARLNLERAGAFTRLMLLAYFTVPLTVGAILAQLAPQ